VCACVRVCVCVCVCVCACACVRVVDVQYTSIARKEHTQETNIRVVVLPGQRHDRSRLRLVAARKSYYCIGTISLE